MRTPQPPWSPRERNPNQFTLRPAAQRQRLVRKGTDPHLLTVEQAVYQLELARQAHSSRNDQLRLAAVRDAAIHYASWSGAGFSYADIGRYAGCSARAAAKCAKVHRYWVGRGMADDAVHAYEQILAAQQAAHPG